MRATAPISVAAAGLFAVCLIGCTAETTLTAEETTVMTDESTATPVDLCGLGAPSGAASEAVSAQGPFGSPATATFAVPLTVTGVERSVLSEGGGDPIGSTDLVRYAFTTFDAASGAQLKSQGYEDAADTLPVAAASIGQLVGCAAVGSRIAVAMPQTEDAAATVWVIDVLEAEGGRADGQDQPPVDGMPVVTLAEDGAPVIEIPRTNPPAQTEVAVLKKGDGAIVRPGDSVLVQYTGARWSDGTTFDSSWSTGAPTVLVTTDVIAGYKTALEGQTVGSQVIAVIPPSSAYGEGQINESDLIGETLVFVVDLLHVAPAAP